MERYHQVLEKDPRTNAVEHNVEARRLAHVSGAAPVAIELHARGCIVHEQNVDSGAPTELVDLVPRVVRFA